MDFPVLRGSFHSVAVFLRRLDEIPRRRRTLLIGIDGCGGSGKSTLARRLGEARPDVTVVHIDDFYLPADERPTGPHEARPVGSDFDWRRLEREY